MEGARAALEESRYADAIKACKQLLKQDRSNYAGFVLLGTALVRSRQHLDQAEMSFNKAISLDSSALPAYQGLVELREATGTPEQLVQSYEAAAKAASGQSDVAKEFLRKAAAGNSKLQQFDRAKALWQEILDMQGNDEELSLEALCGVVDAEAAIVDLNIQEYQKKQASVKLNVSPEELLSMAQVAWARTENCKVFESRVREVVAKMPHNEVYQVHLLQILLHRVRASSGQEFGVAKQKLASHCMVMLLACPSKQALELLLAIAEEDDSEELFQPLKSGNASFFCWLGKHVAHLYPGLGVSMSGGSRKGLAAWDVSCDEHSISGWRALAKEQCSAGFLDRASESTKRGVSAVALKRKAFGLALKAAEQEMRLLQADILLLEKKLNEASRIYLSVAEEAKDLPEYRRTLIIADAFQGLVKLSIAMKQTDVAKLRLNDILDQDPENHWALSERGWLEYESRSFSQARSDLEKAVSACQSSAVYHYRLGCIYWEMDGMAQKALSEFLESAKIDPSQPKAFLYLGHYYKEHGKDSRRAVRCYRKAVSLDPENESAGEVLCDMLDNGGQYELEKNICEEAAKKSPRAFWASRRMGFIQLAQNNWSTAVTSIQYALRGFPQDARLWEALGLSYKKLGMFSAALKAFGRALALDSSSLFSALEMGAIQLTLSLFSKASLAYRQALQIFPGDQTATFGLISALLGTARECVSQGAFTWCASLLKEAMHLAGKNRFLHAHFVSGWKQLGDANLLYAQSLPFDTELNGKNTMTTELLNDTWKEAVDAWEDERIAAAKNAVYAYKCAIHLLPDEASLYRDLAMALEYACSLTESPKSGQWSEAAIVVCSGLQLDATNADMWVTLGLVTQHKGLQQHAFIQALRLDPNHALAWAYLGQLYLSSHDQILAQHSFDRARSADSTLALTWMGMSAVHSHNDRKNGLLKAFANCSCAVQLSSTMDFHAGVGQLAAQTQQLSLPEVNVALRKAVQKQPSKAAIHNLNGLSSESRNDFRTAVLAYRNARAAASGSNRLQNIITSNLARALCKARYADAALVEYHKLFANGALDDLNDLRGFAVALKQSGQGRKAELVVSKVIDRVTQDAQYTVMLTLLAKLTYHSRGPVPAFNLLLRAPDALFLEKDFCMTTLALGISTREQGSLSAALNRCRSILTSEHAPDAYILLASGTQTNGLTRNLVRALHSHPQSQSLRARLAQIINVQTGGLQSALAEQLCSSHLIVSDLKLTRNLTFMVLTDAAVASSFKTLRGSETLAALKRLVHMEPYNIDARYCYLLYLFQDARRRDYPQHLCRTISRLSTITLPLLSSSDTHTYMRCELELCISECELRCGDTALALEHAKVAANSGRQYQGLNAAAILQLGRCYSLLEDQSSAKASVSGWQQLQIPNNFPWQLSLLELELRWQPETETYRNVSRFRQAIQQADQRWLALLEVLVAKHHFESGDLQLSEEAAAKALSLWLNNPFLHLFHGATCMELVKSGTNALNKALSSLVKAVNLKQQQGVDLPVACTLLAQAESSRDPNKASSIRKWASNLRKEFTTWPAEVPMPAEMCFQMALLAKQKQIAQEDGLSSPEMTRSWRGWLQLALHLNPACQRYWHLATTTK